MIKKCPTCGLANLPEADRCIRCGGSLDHRATPKKKNTLRSIVVRIVICLVVCCLVILGFYVSLVKSARPLTPEQGYQTRRAIALLKERGFGSDIFILAHLSIFRGEDNWLNASVAKEDAYAATNFPFGIVTIYPDFFTYPIDDTERAAILLHESRHLRGEDEHAAYEFVWEHRKQLGWTKDKYEHSVVWRNIRKQTKDTVPELFTCDWIEFSDCTE